MGTILEYLSEVTESFAQRPFSQVDSLVLSQLDYIYFDGFVPGPGGAPVSIRDIAGPETVAAMVKGVRAPEQNTQLVELLAESPRFQSLRLANYVNIVDKDAEEQFSAVTFLLDGGAYVAYRGTDAYYVAWKEDFNLAFTSPVPSQLAGAEYLKWAASLISGPIRVGGHSKGGNLAVYSALFCGEQAQSRIQAVYSHDGPGFEQGVLDSSEFSRMQDRIYKTMPQGSLVGILLQHQENYQVIQSNSFFIMQHDPFSWVVDDGEFRYLESLSASSLFLDKSLNEWISSLSKEELSAFADALYRVLCALGGETFADLPSEWWKAAREALDGLRGLDGDTYSIILHTVGSLFSLAFKNLPRPKIQFTLPEWNLPSLPTPKGIHPKAALPEGFLEKLPFWKKPETPEDPGKS